MLIGLLAVIMVGGVLLKLMADQSRSMGDLSPTVGLVDDVGQLVLILVFVVAFMLLLF